MKKNETGGPLATPTPSYTKKNWSGYYIYIKQTKYDV